METKIISIESQSNSGTEDHGSSDIAIETKIIRNELRNNLLSITTGGIAGENFDSEKDFDDLMKIQESTQGKSETVVSMTDQYSNGKVGNIKELNSAKGDHGSVSYSGEELKDTQATYHNHPTHSKNKSEIVLQGFSGQDKKANQQTKELITQSQGKNQADKYTHFLGMDYEVDGEIYKTVIAGGLDSENHQWKQFRIGNKQYHQAIKCPDGVVRDIMELPIHVADHILRRRMLAVDNNQEIIRQAS